MTRSTNLTVLGTGFAAMSLIRRIDTRRYEVVVVSPRNHFLFTPLLPSTTVGTIEFRSIIEPIRTARKGIRYIPAACEDIEPETREIVCHASGEDSSFRISYDRLVIAVGAKTHTFGLPGVEEHALFLKELSDAREIRQRLIECVERASTPAVTEAERTRLLHAVIVGGGPTGVEFAAELHDFLQRDLRKGYPDVAGLFRITLLESRDSILTTFDATLQAYAARSFARDGIEVRTGSLVESVEPSGVTLSDGTVLPAGLVVWSAGIAATPFVQGLRLAKDARGRLITDDSLRCQGQANVLALGDAAVIEGLDFPATAQTAQQQGAYLARSLNRETRGKEMRPFRYRHMGMLAYIGRHRALADLPHVKGSGLGTWVFWRSAYLTRLVSWKNKVQVVFDWAKTLVFGRDISRF